MSISEGTQPGDHDSFTFFGRERCVFWLCRSTDAAKLTFAFEAALARPPTAEESQLCLAFLRTQRERFLVDPESAAAVAQGRPAPHADVAAWIMVASTLLNLDETITKQ